MKHIKIINEKTKTRPRSLALIGEGFFGGISSELQLQIESNGNNAYIDLSIDEVKILLSKLHQWLSENHSEHGEGMNYSVIEKIQKGLIVGELLFDSSKSKYDFQKEALDEAKEAYKKIRYYFSFGEDYGIKKR